MVWDEVMGQKKTRLIVIPGNLNAQCYVNEVLDTDSTFVKAWACYIAARQCVPSYSSFDLQSSCCW